MHSSLLIGQLQDGICFSKEVHCLVTKVERESNASCKDECPFSDSLSSTAVVQQLTKWGTIGDGRKNDESSL
ncbi:hypothetical protein M514_27017 [Trichuris suis]|uniref:Uncharacterized protein n=1 Tax=Trichuris suis TaxID=68888 RepID=A0A085MUA1_9BILA|nr:hypothetical protein M514_04763 [Trichuris suis]KFD60797.1 hypothetical protein M514_27017 [Trichuris suis]